METPRDTRRGRALLAVAIAASLALPAGLAQAHPVKRFWEYEQDVRQHTWKSHTLYKRKHRRWHKRHPNATWRHHKSFHHHGVTHRHRLRHRFRVGAKQVGEASYFSGAVGACGVPLEGLYAAHRSWPCGSKVSVKRGGKYVIVRILDRGPFTHGRVIDLSREAFDRLGSLSEGVMGVEIYRLLGRRR